MRCGTESVGENSGRTEAQRRWMRGLYNVFDRRGDRGPVIALCVRGPRTIPPRARVTVFDNLLCKAGIQVDVQLLTCPHPRGRRLEQGVHSPVSRRGMRQVVADSTAVVAPPALSALPHDQVLQSSGALPPICTLVA